MIPESIRASSIVTAEESDAQSAGALGQEDFLRMLITQLENQDPLNPQDATEFTAQLAQFSSLEQLIAMREGIEALAETSQPAASDEPDSRTFGLEGVPLVGRSVLHESSSFQVGAEGGLPDLFVELVQPGALQGIEIRDANGTLVRQLGVTGTLPAGVTRIDLGEMDPLPTGVYSFTASRGDQSLANTLVLDRVTGSSIGESDPTLFFGEAEGSLSRVREVRP
ncbi:MAG: flagellar hook capping FlgD N-terminal domain-containing protein [Myxococcota bacterium]|nr:flagellar hook capping FlgD N-terminal domain-containing protein [Myxococcota bacterium]